MRIVALILGCVCGAIIIALASRFGFSTADDTLDGCIAALTYGSIALGGLIIHVSGIRLATRHGKRAVGTIAVVIGLVILAISLTNNIDATAERLNATHARRAQTEQSVRDDRRDLERMQAEREALKFDPTDWSAVSAARAKAEAATAVRRLECDKRGDKCRAREKEEEEALAGAEKAGRDKASTDRAAKLDKDIPLLKEKIAKAGPVLKANAPGKALASIFSLTGDTSTRQFTLTNGGLEVITFCLFVLYELMEPKTVPQKQDSAVSVPRPKRTYRKRQPSGQSAKIIQMPRPDMDKILELSKSGKTHEQIGAIVGISAKTVQRRLKEYRTEAMEMAGA